MARKSAKRNDAPKSGDAGVYKLPLMSKKETEALLKSCSVCRMALNDRVQPYLICLDYAYVDGKMYFHFADYGRKMVLLAKDPHVSVEIDDYNPGRTKYKNATFMGKVVKVTKAEEKKKAATAIVEAIRPASGQKKAAARHGYDALDEALFASRDSVIMRLDVREYVALKSP